MSPADELVTVLRTLRLSGVLETLALRIDEAASDNLAFEEFLYRLLNDELDRRDQKRLTNRIRKAKFEHATSLEDFDFVFNPLIPKAKIINLATCAFAKAYENILFAGPTGTGKSHLAQAIGHRACLLGIDTRFVQARALFALLRAARAEHGYEKIMREFTRPGLLIIDDLGLRPLRDTSPEDLYELIRRRHRHGSTIITTNRAFEELPALFNDELLASAALDRLLERAHLIELQGKSYRRANRTSR
jgi:DNA replication protein DnaC